MTSGSPYPRISLGAYIFHHRKILLMRRKKTEDTQGFWCTPGGKLHLGESFADAALREVKEEVGIDLKNDPIIHHFTNNVFSPTAHYVIFHMISVVEDSTFKNHEPEKHENLAWYDWDNLPSPLVPSMQEYVNAVKNGQLAHPLDFLKQQNLQTKAA